MKLLKVIISFIALISLQIAAAQWLNVPPPVEAKNLMIFTAGVPVAGGSCTQVSSEGESYDDWWALGRLSYEKYGCYSYVPGSSFTLTQLSFHMTKVLSPTFTITAAIYAAYGTAVTDLPDGAALGTSTNNLDASTVSDGYYPFYFSGVSLTSGTQYRVCGIVSAVNEFNYIRMESDSSSQTGEWFWSADGSTWTASASAGTTHGTYKTYSGTCP